MSPCCLMLTQSPFFISEPSKQGSNWQHQLRLSSLYELTLWRQHYVKTSKEYLISCHILLQYFELAFFQLQLVQIWCKLIIIWVNYEKKQKGSFYETLCILNTLLEVCWTFAGSCKHPISLLLKYSIQTNIRVYCVSDKSRQLKNRKSRLSHYKKINGKAVLSPNWT